MPKVFKALSSITAWILFVGGCLGVLFAVIGWIKTPDITEVNTALTIDFLVAVVTLVAGVAVMRLRQKME
jgi:multisubunit Na+/H+ antiporter MnhG subunit